MATKSDFLVKAGLTVSNNLTFSGTGNRILGDFSNATVASRVNFQTSTTNGATYVSTLPLGTGTASGFFSYNAADGDNASFIGTYLTSAVSIVNSGKNGTGTYLPMTFYTNGSERMRIDTSGITIVGGTTSIGAGQTTNIQSQSTGGSAGVSAFRFSNDTIPPRIQVGKSRGTTVGSYTAVQSGDSLGGLYFYGADGTNIIPQGASIIGQVDGTVSTGSVAGRIIFNTTLTGDTNPTERMRIDSSGNVGIGTAPATLLHVSGSSTTAIGRIASTGTGATSFDGSGAGLELLAAGMNTTSKYTPAIKFGSTDTDFTTTYPKFGASIIASAAQTYSSDTTGGMNLEFWTAPANPGTGSGLVERMRIDSSGNVGIGTSTVSIGASRELSIGSPAAGTGSLNYSVNGVLTGYLSSNTSSTNLYAYGATPVLLFGTNNTERMRIRSDGSVSIGGTGSSAVSLYIQAPTTGAVTAYGILAYGTVQNDVTASAHNIQSQSNIASGTAITNYTHFRATEGTISGSMTNQYGFAAISDLTSATNNYGFIAQNTAAIGAGKTSYGFYSSVNTATGGGTTYGFYAAGTAYNYFAGNVGIGTSSPNAPLHILANSGDMFRLDRNNTAVDTGNQIAFRHSNAGTLTETGSINVVSAANADSASMRFYTKPSGGSNTERMRIDSSGNLLVGATSVSGNQNGLTYEIAGNGLLRLFHPNGAASGALFQAFIYNGGSIGSITQSGTTAVSYNTSSDYRLKENIQPMTTGLAKISALKPVTYDWISDKSSGEGFIAHELQSVIPLAVTGEKDAVDEEGNIKPQGVDYSKIVVHLVAAIQELKAEFDAYKAAHS